MKQGILFAIATTLLLAFPSQGIACPPKSRPPCRKDYRAIFATEWNKTYKKFCQRMFCQHRRCPNLKTFVSCPVHHKPQLARSYNSSAQTACEQYTCKNTGTPFYFGCSAMVSYIRTDTRYGSFTDTAKNQTAKVTFKYLTKKTMCYPACATFRCKKGLVSKKVKCTKQGKKIMGFVCRKP